LINEAITKIQNNPPPSLSSNAWALTYYQTNRTVMAEREIAVLQRCRHGDLRWKHLWPLAATPRI